VHLVPEEVYLAHHNITPAVDEQLVLELEVQERLAEGIDRLPGGLSRR
jgi:hypothetical protein